jgi:hypothetical protein
VPGAGWRWPGSRRLVGRDLRHLGDVRPALIGTGWIPGAAVLTRIGVAALILTAPQ